MNYTIYKGFALSSMLGQAVFSTEGVSNQSSGPSEAATLVTNIHNILAGHLHATRVKVPSVDLAIMVTGLICIGSVTSCHSASDPAPVWTTLNIPSSLLLVHCSGDSQGNHDCNV